MSMSESDWETAAAEHPCYHRCPECDRATVEHVTTGAVDCASFILSDEFRCVACAYLITEGEFPMWVEAEDGLLRCEAVLPTAHVDGSVVAIGFCGEPITIQLNPMPYLPSLREPPRALCLAHAHLAVNHPEQS